MDGSSFINTFSSATSKSLAGHFKTTEPISHKSLIKELAALITAFPTINVVEEATVFQCSGDT